MTETAVVTQPKLVLSPERKAMREQLESYINSKLLPAHIRTVDQAEVIVGIGREIGLPAIASMRTIHLINGSPTVSPAMMVALANKRGFIEDQKLEKFADKVVFTIKRKGRETAHVETFGVKEATALQLMGKDNYKKQPITMFAWRAISAAMRFMFPDVIFGLYTPEEMGAIIDIDPENELEAKGIHEEPNHPRAIEAKPAVVSEPMPQANPDEQMTAKQASTIMKQVEEIKIRLAQQCQGDIERMNAQLILLTEHKAKDGSTEFVELKDLPIVAETRPQWIPAILAKMDKLGIANAIH